MLQQVLETGSERMLSRCPVTCRKAKGTFCFGSTQKQVTETGSRAEGEVSFITEETAASCLANQKNDTTKVVRFVW